jgi:lipopolysaccharide export system permease protein
VVATLIGSISLFASNFLKPASLLQFNKRFITIRKQKSALSIEEGIFNTTFGETIIRVGKVDKDKRGIHDILIYDHSDSDKSLVRVYSSKHGEMFTADEGRYFVMKLDTGVFYREDNRKTTLGSNKTKYPFLRTYFDQYVKSMDMSVFNADDGLLNFNRDREQMMNSWQLFQSIDSFKFKIRENEDKISMRLKMFALDDGVDRAHSTNNSSVSPSKSRSLERPEMSADSVPKLSRILPQKPPAIQQPLPGRYLSGTSLKVVTQTALSDRDSYRHLIESIDSVHVSEVLVRAQSQLSRARDEISTARNINRDFEFQYQKYMLRLNQQYSWAMVCVVFLFIGAPLGSIIRKGGYGYPLLVAILFYMIFIISTIYGEKLVKNDSMQGLQAAWLPCLLLMPFAVGLTYMALKDMKFNPGIFMSIWYKVFPPRS